MKLYADNEHNTKISDIQVEQDNRHKLTTNYKY